jgi:predicted dehydrogenase
MTSSATGPVGPPLRWGIVGTGGIARRFAADLALLPDAEVVAVGSRSAGSAEEFGQRLEISRRHASYRSLVEDRAVDAVYVATPHPAHHDPAMLAIEAGKAVLVEKPFTLNAPQARSLVATARARGVFLMEAMWTRFLPHMVRIRELLADGALGGVRTVVADHGQWFAPDPAHRLFAPELGGGALLDLGVYPVSFASMVLGPPARIAAVSDPALTGVDAQTSVLLQYDGGAHALLTATLQAVGPTRAAVVGTDARIEVESRWYQPAPFALIRRDGSQQRFDLSPEGHGLRLQAAEVARCIRSGLLESPVMPLDETVEVMATMDEVRRQIGLSYPQEQRS